MQAQKTWESFQVHFSQAHQELRESGELEERKTPFNTNKFVKEVIDGVQQVLQPAMEASYKSEAMGVQHHANTTTAYFSISFISKHTHDAIAAIIPFTQTNKAFLIS